MSNNLDMIAQIVNDIAAKNFIAVDPAFDSVMSDRISNSLAARKQEIASTMFGSPAAETTETPAIQEPTGSDE